MEKELAIGFYNTEPLWINKQFGITQFKFPEIDFTNYIAKLIPEKLRLGHQIEYIFEQLLAFSTEWELISKNLLVYKEKINIGELDFILKNRNTHKYVHIELTYKFYIVNPVITEPIHRLIGPNKKDMFYTKLDKLKNKQFPLLYNDELAPALKKLKVETTEIEQQACFKAQLFFPYGNTTSIRPLNKKCIQGSWVSFDNFNTSIFKNYTYYIPYKQEWVLQPNAKRTYVSHYKTLLEINLRMLKENTPMLWLKKTEELIEKIFVVWW